MYSAAIIGFGGIAEGTRGDTRYAMTHAGAYEALSGRVRVTAIVDPDEARLALAKKRFPAAALFRNAGELLAAATPDLLSLCLPEAMNGEFLLDTAASGIKGIWCEKPIATTMTTATRLRQLLPLRMPVQVNFWRRFIPEIERTVNEIRDGRYGAINHVSGYYAERCIGNGSHLVDLAQWLVGRLHLQHAAATESLPPAGDGPVVIHARSAGGIHCLLAPIPRRRFNIFELDVFCEQARIRFCENGRRIEISADRPDAEYPHLRILDTEPQVTACTWRNAFTAGLADLLDCMDGRKTAPLSGPEAALDCSEFLAGVRSAVAPVPTC